MTHRDVLFSTQNVRKLSRRTVSAGVSLSELRSRARRRNAVPDLTAGVQINHIEISYFAKFSRDCSKECRVADESVQRQFFHVSTHYQKQDLKSAPRKRSITLIHTCLLFCCLNCRVA